MAKSKADLLAEAQAAGLVADDVDVEKVTAEQLRSLLSDDRPAHEGSRSSMEPLIAPDGHVNLSQEDLDERDLSEEERKERRNADR